MNSQTIRSVLLLFCLLINSAIFAQSPPAIPYQGVARNAACEIFANQNITVRFGVFPILIGGTPLFRETHSVTTNSLGLFNINIGTGSLETGSFNTIDWANGPRYLEVEIDTAGGSNFILLGRTQFLSVPYALHAETANIKGLPQGTTAGQILVWDGTDWILSTVCDLFNNDPNNCGGCGKICPAVIPNGSATCDNGVCIITCDPDYDDCDGDVTNGCEVYLNALANCGACGAACPVNPVNGSFTCINGQCVLSCTGSFANCDGNPANGCETNLNNSVTHCGNCNSPCPPNPPGGTYQCNFGTCILVCNSGRADCDGLASNGCEINLSFDNNNCGTCGNVCIYPNAMSQCNSGTCIFLGCVPGFANCDGNLSNGCEVNLQTNNNHCGNCNVVCPPGTTCVNGVCQ